MRLGLPRTSRASTDSRTVVYGVTVGSSAYSLLRGQLHWLQRQGWRVLLVTTPGSEASAAARREGVELIPIPMKRSISPIADIKAFVQWLNLLGVVKPVSVNVSTPKAGLLGGMAAWVRGVPSRVYVVRGLRLEGAVGVIRKALWLSEWLSMKVATDVLFVSRSLVVEAFSLGLLDRKKSWLIGHGSSNGVDAAAIERRVSETNRNELRRRLNLNTTGFVVGFIGRIARDKGVESLIAAMSAFSEDQVQLLTIGSVEDSELERRLQSLGKRVRSVPWTNDVWGHLAAIDVLCLPTRREGFPNVVLEAAAAAIPVITTRATGAVDSVRDGETGFLVDVDDVAGLVERIDTLRQNPDLVHRLGVEANKWVNESFKPVRIWEGVAALLEGGSRACVHARSLRHEDFFRPQDQGV